MSNFGRRALLGGTVSALGLAKVGHALPDPYDTLVSGQYDNTITLQQAGGQYFGSDFKLTPVPTKWLLKTSSYIDPYRGGKFSRVGYWIFRPDVNMCWQAENNGGSGLDYWNQDGKATGNPEDWETFMFYPIDKSQGAVGIGHNNYNYAIDLEGDTFTCRSTSNAAVFYVGFG